MGWLKFAAAASGIHGTDLRWRNGVALPAACCLYSSQEQQPDVCMSAMSQQAALMNPYQLPGQIHGGA